MTVQASLRMRHQGCVTERMTGDLALMQVSGERGFDVFVLHARSPERLEQGLRWCEEYARNTADMVGRTETSMVFRGINPPWGVPAAIRASGASILWPAVYRDGLEHYTVLVRDRPALRDLVEQLRTFGEVTVERAVDVAPAGLGVSVPLTELTADLTARQLRALRAAVGSGYYATPRRTSTAELAARMGVGRTTFDEHLRKAEARVLERFAALLAQHEELAGPPTRGRGRPKGLGKASKPPKTRRTARIP